MADAQTEPVVGIDLGTTFSVVAQVNADGRSAIIPNAEGEITTPSVVFLDPAGAVVGREAVKAAEFEPDRVARHPKRSMGLKHYPTPVRGEHWPPEVLQAAILRRLKIDAERVLGPLTRAVITVPAYFNEPRRKATQDAGRMAGWDVLDILNEPTAAAIAFGVRAGFVNPAGGAPTPETVLVYDLGGGTFDATVMRIEQDRFTVLATAGDVQLGGIDWDDRIVDLVAAECVRQFRVDPRTDPAARERLRAEAEAAKRALTARPTATVAFAWEEVRVRVVVTREMFDEMTGDLVDRTRLTVRRLIKDAGLTYAGLTRVLLVGGSTRMPMVAAMLAEEIGREPDRSLAPDEAIALGAAVYANAILGRFGEGRLRVTNVNAHDLGVLGVDRATGMPRRKIMIRRNTPLPAEATHRFRAHSQAQKAAVVKVIEGGDDSGNGSTPIGQCVVSVPGDPDSERTIAVTYRYAENGRLEVTAQTEEGAPAQLVVERATGMPEAELDRWAQRVQAGLVPVEPASAERASELAFDEDSSGADEPGENPFDFRAWK
jgi:molecular chaperone DnaK